MMVELCADRSSMISDLPLNFHPATTGARLVFTPIGVDTITKTDPIARSDTTSRLQYIIPMAQPARHRGQSEKSSLRRSKLGEQCTNLQTLVMNEGPAGGRSLRSGCSRWFGQILDHPEITPPSNFQHFRGATSTRAKDQVRQILVARVELHELFHEFSEPGLWLPAAVAPGVKMPQRLLQKWVLPLWQR